MISVTGALSCQFWRIGYSHGSATLSRATRYECASVVYLNFRCWTSRIDLIMRIGRHVQEVIACRGRANRCDHPAARVYRGRSHCGDRRRWSSGTWPENQSAQARLWPWAGGFGMIGHDQKMRQIVRPSECHHSRWVLIESESNHQKITAHRRASAFIRIPAALPFGD